jgi:MFS transporter, PPP family, 3-phenylpropionic acid transporter
VPLYLATLGFAGWQIGIATGAQPGLRWLAAIGWAYAADRWRVRHRALVGTAVAGAVCFVPLLFARGFAAVMVVMAAIALLHGPLIPLLDATVIDHLPRMGGDYGRLRLFGSAAFVAGALASAPLVDRFSPGAVPLLLLVPALFLGPALAPLPREQHGHPEGFRPPWALVGGPMTAFLATAFLIHLSSGAWTGFFALHAQALGFSPAIPGITWALAVTAEIVLFFFSRRILSWIAPPDLIVVCLLVTVARWAATAVATREVVVVALQLGHAFTFSAFHLAALALVARLVPVESSTSGQALYGLVGFGFGGSAGLALAGLLVDRLGTAGLFGFEAVVALAGVVPALVLRRAAR